MRAAVATGAPVAVVLVAGRPLVVEEWIEEPGAVNPSGRLPMGFPRHEGHLPAVYDAHENTGRPASPPAAAR